MATELAPAGQAGQSKQTTMARYLPTAARIVLGLILLIFGLNGFFAFIPAPKTPIPAGALAFNMALAATGYMIKLVAGTQAVVGVLLLINRFVPLALALIAPVIVNIVFFHVFLAPAPSMVGPAVVVTVLEVYLAWLYRDAFAPMLAMRPTPGVK